jgi:hypothetical protein
VLSEPTEQPFKSVRVDDANGLYRVTFRGASVGWVAAHERHARIARLNGIYASAQARRRTAQRAARGEGETL